MCKCDGTQAETHTSFSSHAGDVDSPYRRLPARPLECLECGIRHPASLLAATRDQAPKPMHAQSASWAHPLTGPRPPLPPTVTLVAWQAWAHSGPRAVVYAGPGRIVHGRLPDDSPCRPCPPPPPLRPRPLPCGWLQTEPIVHGHLHTSRQSIKTSNQPVNQSINL